MKLLTTYKVYLLATPRALSTTQLRLTAKAIASSPYTSLKSQKLINILQVSRKRIIIFRTKVN